MFSINVNNQDEEKEDSPSVNYERVLMSSEKDILHAVNSFTSKLSKNTPENNCTGKRQEPSPEQEQKQRQIFKKHLNKYKG